MKGTTIAVLAMLAVGVPLNPRSLAAQRWGPYAPDDTQDTWLASLSVAAGLATIGVSGKIEATFYPGPEPWGVAVRAASVEEFSLLGPSPSLEARDLGLLAVYRTSAGNKRSAIGIGLALTSGRDRGNRLSPGRYEAVHWVTIGIPLEFETLVVGPWVGIGGEVFINANVKRPFLGIALQVVVGRLLP